MSQPFLVSQVRVAEDRQRKEFGDIESLAASFERVGQITPIVIRKDGTLIAGERRLRAAQHLGWTEIRAEFMDDLSSIDAEIIELEENVKRADLSWQETALAVHRIHALFEQKNPEWSRSETCREVSMSTQHVGRLLAVADAMLLNPEIAKITTLSTAYNFVTRDSERRITDVVHSLTGMEFLTEDTEPEAEAEPEAPEPLEVELSTPQLPGSPAPTTAAVTKPTPRPTAAPAPAILPPEASILDADFIKWSQEYSGPLFNFIHCDFPYAAGAGKSSSQINAGGELGHYADSKDIFWKLCEALMDSMSNVVAPSAHLMIWHASSLFIETHNFFKEFEKSHDLRVFPIPLIWHKTDNTGVVADPARRPRHIYESALFISRGDRKITKPLADVYGAPVSRSIHPAEKPVPMLQHFFGMLVSDTTRMLDPTAGSATSLRAAETLGAEFVLGLEIDHQFREAARSELASFRRKRLLANLEKKT